MTQQSHVITYRFIPNNSQYRAITLTVELDPDTLEQVLPEELEKPAWTSLGFEQCEHCPLHPSEHSHCPVALRVVDLVEKFNPLFSFGETEVVVETSERTVSRKTTTQKALSSLLGLQMATSGCPNMNMLKPMARFHLPFATKEETVFRAASMYLLGQYYLHLRGLPCDMTLEGLADCYMRVHKVNMGMAKRLRSIALGDANINAIVLLDLLAHELPSAIDLKLKQFEHLFSSFFEDGGYSPLNPSETPETNA